MISAFSPALLKAGVKVVTSATVGDLSYMQALQELADCWYGEMQRLQELVHSVSGGNGSTRDLLEQLMQLSFQDGFNTAMRIRDRE